MTLSVAYYEPGLIKFYERKKDSREGNEMFDINKKTASHSVSFVFSFSFDHTLKEQQDWFLSKNKIKFRIFWG